MPELSIIIPTLKPHSEVECIRALERDPFSDYEVLLQDEDQATTARNQGIKRADSDKLVFFDDDSNPRKGYLRRVSEILDNEAAVAGRTVHPRNDIFADGFASHYDFGDQPRYVSRFWGCNMAVKKSVFGEVGMWDEDIPWGHEEIELAERVLTTVPIYYDPSLVVDHPYADSITDYWWKMYRLEKRKPRLWEKLGVPKDQQRIKIIKSFLTPTRYFGHSLKQTVVRGGGSISKTIGQIHGMYLLRKQNK